ncbi:MAG: hypothetical protein ACREVK_01370, partial [Gammaproteobacteria bacterium]
MDRGELLAFDVDGYDPSRVVHVLSGQSRGGWAAGRKINIDVVPRNASLKNGARYRGAEADMGRVLNGGAGSVDQVR